MSEEIIWQSMLDDRYLVKVTRTGLYRAELTIGDGDVVLHRQDVILMYDALFGPDIDDVATWQDIAIAFVDRLCKG